MTTVKRALVYTLVVIATFALVVGLVYVFVSVGEGSGGSGTGEIFTTTG